MAQITELSPLGVPGAVHSFVAKAEAEAEEVGIGGRVPVSRTLIHVYSERSDEEIEAAWEEELEELLMLLL